MPDSPNALPQWLQHNEPPGTPVLPARRARRRGALEKTLHDIAEAFKNEVFAERIARRAGLLQQVDPRVKLLTVLLLICTAAILRHATLLVLLNGWVLWLAHTSRVPLRVLVRRVWPAVLIFTGLVVLPAVFNVVRPGTPLLVLFEPGHRLHLGPWLLPRRIALTRQGVAGAVLLILRVAACVSLAVLLTLTTRWRTLLKALGVLRVPRVFVSVLEMTYRYVFLLLQISQDMFTARKSRSVGRRSAAGQRRFAANAMGNLWARAFVHSEEVHAAMLSRGYAGRPRALAELRLQAGDALWCVIVLLVILLLVGGNLVLG